MSNYVYDNVFENKDSLPSGDPNKIIKATEFDVEFKKIETMSTTKMDTSNPTFTGTMTGVNLVLTGTLDVALIDGGTYSG